MSGVLLRDISETGDVGEIPIHKFPFRVGRGSGKEARLLTDTSLPTNNLYLPDTSRPLNLSREHFEINTLGGEYYVVDRGSVSGTIVNGTRVGGNRQRGKALLDQPVNEIIVGSPRSPFRFEVILSEDQEKHRMVISEDEEQELAILCEVFGEEYDIWTARDGAEAIKHIVKEYPDIVLLDWVVPKIHGVEVCRRMKSSSVYSEIPVVMVTGRADVADRVRGLEVGADDYVIKPYNVLELRTRVKGIVSRSLRARGVHGGTGMVSEEVFRNEVDRRLAAKKGRSEVEVLFLELEGLGEHQKRHGREETDRLVRGIYRDIHRAMMYREGKRAMVGQIANSEAGILTTVGDTEKVRDVLVGEVGAKYGGITLSASVVSNGTGGYENYYEIRHAARRTARR